MVRTPDPAPGGSMSWKQRLVLTLAVTALAVAGACLTALAANPKTGSWTGKTSQKGTSFVEFKVVKKGGKKYVKSFALRNFKYTCSDGVSGFQDRTISNTTLKPKRIKKKGKFKFAETLAGQKTTVRGRFTKPKRAKGSVSWTKPAS